MSSIEDKIREQIAFGISPTEVALYHNITIADLMKDYGHVVRTACVDLDVAVAKTYYQICVGELPDEPERYPEESAAEYKERIKSSAFANAQRANHQACATWLKSRGNWDKLREHSKVDTEKKQISKVTIQTLAADYDPDAKEDPQDDN